MTQVATTQPTPEAPIERSRPLDRGLDAAYEHCRRVTAEHARTFYFASRFLAQQKRRACYAIYAFCRYVDDLADEHAGATERLSGTDLLDASRRAIATWSDDLDAVYRGEGGDDPVMIAWADMLGRYEIPRSLPEELIDGCVSDLRAVVRFADFAELRTYCYKVASVVGLMTGRVFGYTDPRAEERAIDLGIAMQLTNILRDVGEDARENRIYLPLDELAAAGITPEEIIAAAERGELSARAKADFRAFMIEQIARARSYYASADEGIALLEQDSRRTVRLMSRNYAGILAAIERNDYDVFTRRASVSTVRKIGTIFRRP